MKLKLKSIYNAIPALRKIGNINIKPKAAIKIGCLIADLDKYTKSIGESVNKLRNELGTKNKAGFMEIDTDSPNYPKFEKQFEACLDIDIDFNLEFPIDLEDLEDIKITPLEMQALNIFIKKEK